MVRMVGVVRVGALGAAFGASAVSANNRNANANVGARDGADAIAGLIPGHCSWT